MIESYCCPRCSRQLPISGVVAVGDEELPVFQCDDCTSDVVAFGQSLRVAFTFVVRADGSWYEPAATDND